MGVALPFGFAPCSKAITGRVATALPPVLGFRGFEQAVREAFAFAGATPAADGSLPGEAFPCRRIEVGHAEILLSGVQGCQNDRPFAGFPAGHLRIVRAGSEPGPVVGGVRLYVSTVDVALTGGRVCGGPTRRLDFALLPPAPTLTDPGPDPTVG